VTPCGSLSRLAGEGARSQIARRLRAADSKQRSCPAPPASADRRVQPD
jgi:hypothetical protein